MDDDGVLIGDGQCRLRLKRAGPPDEAGYPTRIEVEAGPFRGTVTDDTVGSYPRFRDQLSRLNETLRGTARLTSREGFELALDGNGRGAVEVKVALEGGHEAPISLSFAFAIDQSHLAALITAIEREFLKPSPAGG
ncbi:hypothetical protein SAMN05444161_1676 [Rhizobiales bacterium GAS191]|nr:hypothetical protein SAMN05519104_1642 [Rhizobiales bacterium GAS188]SEC70898.1 hypothetical protein SAMN05444161_1676 [Rhizobiales bacterium GAS191]